MESIAWEVHSMTCDLLAILERAALPLCSQQHTHLDTRISQQLKGERSTSWLQEGRRHLRQLESKLQVLHEELIPALYQNLATEHNESDSVSSSCSSQVCSILRSLWKLMSRLPIPILVDDGRDLCVSILNRASACWIELDEWSLVHESKPNKYAAPTATSCSSEETTTTTDNQWNLQTLQLRLAREYPLMQQQVSASTSRDCFLWCFKLLNHMHKQPPERLLSGMERVADDKKLVHIPLVLLHNLLPECLNSLQSISSTSSDFNQNMDGLYPHILIANLLGQVADASYHRPPNTSLEQWLGWQFFPDSVSLPHHHNRQEAVRNFAFLLKEYATLLVETAQDSLDSATLTLRKTQELRGREQPLHQGQEQKSQGDRCRPNDVTQRESEKTSNSKLPTFPTRLKNTQSRETENTMTEEVVDGINVFPLGSSAPNRSTMPGLNQQHQPNQLLQPRHPELKPNPGSLIQLVRPCIEWPALVLIVLESVQHWSLEGIFPLQLLEQLWRTSSISLPSFDVPNLNYMQECGNKCNCDDAANPWAADEESVEALYEMCDQWEFFLWRLTHTVLTNMIVPSHGESTVLLTENTVPTEQALQKLQREARTLSCISLRLLANAPNLSRKHGFNVLWQALQWLIHDNVATQPSVSQEANSLRSTRQNSNTVGRDLKLIIQVALLDARKREVDQHNSGVDAHYNSAPSAPSLLHGNIGFWNTLIPLARPQLSSTKIKKPCAQQDPFDEMFWIEWNRLNQYEDRKILSLKGSASQTRAITPF